jgi:hypothetical protein
MVSQNNGDWVEMTVYKNALCPLCQDFMT